jgi:hypothetical protein
MNDDAKNERMLEIEKKLGWTDEQIHSALDMIHDSEYAEQNSDKEEYSVLFDSEIQNLCFEYMDEFSNPRLFRRENDNS